MEAVLVLLGIVVAIGGMLLVAQFHRERKAERTLEMQAVAARLGWPLTADASFDNVPAVRRFELFARGHHRQLRNFMSGLCGSHHVAVFDYEYATGVDRSSQQWLQTVVNVHTPGVDYPRFELCPEQMIHRIGSLVGHQDIDLARHPDFSRAYLLRGPDEAAIRRAFVPGVVDLIEGNPYVHAEASGPDLFFWYRGHVAGREVPALLDAALALAARLQSGSQEIGDEQRWTEAFARSPDTLSEFARDALAEHRAGRTLPLDPDRM